jgi:hypothetical protein
MSRSALRASRQTDTPTYLIRLQPRRGSDGIPAMRWLLKRAWRLFGLMCLELWKEPVADQPAAAWQEWPASE